MRGLTHNVSYVRAQPYLAPTWKPNGFKLTAEFSKNYRAARRSAGLICNQSLRGSIPRRSTTATTFNMHGYEVFLQARDRFIETLHETLNLLNQIT